MLGRVGPMSKEKYTANPGVVRSAPPFDRCSAIRFVQHYDRSKPYASAKRPFFRIFRTAISEFICHPPINFRPGLRPVRAVYFAVIPVLVNVKLARRIRFLPSKRN